MSDQCNGCSIKAENLHLRMYAPARRATQNAEPVKAIGKCNTAYWFGPGYTEEQEAAIDADKTGEAPGGIQLMRIERWHIAITADTHTGTENELNHAATQPLDQMEMCSDRLECGLGLLQWRQVEGRNTRRERNGQADT